MAIGTWEPEQNKPRDQNALTSELLERAIAASVEDRLEQMTSEFDTDEQTQLSEAMRDTEDRWLRAVEELSSAHVYHLMRFLTIAEMTFKDLELGPRSPIIWLNKLLKKRGEPLQREQVLWIKSNTRNRYLPNGAVL